MTPERKTFTQAFWEAKDIIHADWFLGSTFLLPQREDFTHLPAGTSAVPGPPPIRIPLHKYAMAFAGGKAVSVVHFGWHEETKTLVFRASAIYWRGAEYEY